MSCEEIALIKRSGWSERDMTAVAPVESWRNENDFTKTLLGQATYHYIYPTRTTFIRSRGLRYGKNLLRHQDGRTLRALGFARHCRKAFLCER